jgi:hypothetical protein
MGVRGLVVLTDGVKNMSGGTELLDDAREDRLCPDAFPFDKSSGKKLGEMLEDILHDSDGQSMVIPK